MTLIWMCIVCFALPLPLNVDGHTAACDNYINTMDSCDNKELSGSTIHIDFGVIRFGCICVISLNFNGTAFYSLAKKPVCKNCLTAVSVIDSFHLLYYRLSCTSSPVRVQTNRSSTVELVKENPAIEGPFGYCLRVVASGGLDIITASCKRLYNTCKETDLEHETHTDIQLIIRDTPAVNTTGSTGNGLLIGLIISVILVSISIGISISLALYIVRSRKRKSTTKNAENKDEISEPAITQTPLQNRPTSAYTTLNPGEANDPGEQHYTVPEQNRPASAYTTLNLDEANDPGEQQYTGLKVRIGSEVAQTMYSTRPNSNYTTLKQEQDRDDTENYYSGLNNV